MNIVKLHQLIDQWAAEEREAENNVTTGSDIQEADVSITNIETEKMKDKRVVRTKTSGDRVYLLDEIAKTRQWVTTPEILTALGFSATDVNEVEEVEFLKYGMGPAIYKMPDAKA